MEYEYLVIDSGGNENTLIAGYTVVEGGHVCFCESGYGTVLHVFFQPISSLCLGRYKNEDA